MNTLKGRTAIITGGTGIQGTGVIRALAEGSMNIVMITHNPEQAAKIIDSLGENGKHCVAMSNEQGDDAVIDEVYQRFGSVDVIIPNHGGPFKPKALADISNDDLMDKFEHQVVGSYKMIRKALPYLEKSQAGRIILMANSGARNGITEEGLVDNVARGGIISMTYSLAQSLASKGITVNCIAKSGLVNDHPPKSSEELDSAKLIGKIPVNRIGTPDEFGAAVAWLASEEAAFVTGQVVNLCGGLFMG
jgi:NAD(P)-dependent dehydrogenase (short-subunit alcohol dehydrogenase family)